MRINLENKAKVEKKSIAPVRISHNLEFPYYWKVQHFSFYSEYKWKLDISVSWDLTSSFLRKKNIFVIFFWNLFFHLLFFSPNQMKRFIALTPRNPPNGQKIERELNCPLLLRHLPPWNQRVFLSGLQPLAPVQLCILVCWYWVLWRNLPPGAQETPAQDNFTSVSVKPTEIRKGQEVYHKL